MLCNDVFDNIRTCLDDHINNADSCAANLPTRVIISIVILVIIAATPATIFIVFIAPAFAIIFLHLFVFVVEVGVVGVVLGKLECIGNKSLDVAGNIVGTLANDCLKRCQCAFRQLIVLINALLVIETRRKFVQDRDDLAEIGGKLVADRFGNNRQALQLDNRVTLLLLTLELSEQELDEFFKLRLVKHDSEAAHRVASTLAQAKLRAACELNVDRVHQLVLIDKAGLTQDDQTEPLEDLCADIKAFLLNLGRANALHTA